MKGFRKAGITSSDFSVVGRQYEDEDPFVDLDGQDELQSLIDQISHSETCCDVDEYINGKDDVPVWSMIMTGKIIFLLALIQTQILRFQKNLHFKKILMRKKKSLT